MTAHSACDAAAGSGGSTASDAPLFSLVMAAYNVEEYLPQAIESVQAQTFPDWELIIVDDASSDGTAAIAARYAEEDPRILILAHDENKGASVARATGIAAARGTYIGLPDADDTIDSSLLAQAFDAIRAQGSDPQSEGEEEGPDVVMFGLTEDYYSADGRALYSHALPLQAAAYPTADLWRPLVIGFERATHFGYMATKLYRASIIKEHGLRFPETRLIEDFFFNVAFFRHVRSLAVIDGTPYHYRKVDGRSLTNANAFSAREFYDLHRERIATMRTLLSDWDVFDDEARAILGSLYGRYIISAIERTYHPGEAFDAASRAAWLTEIMGDPLYGELIPAASALESRILECSLDALRSRDVRRCLRLGHGANLARRYMYPLFTKIRSGR